MDTRPYERRGRPVRTGTLSLESRHADLTQVHDVDAWIVPTCGWLTAMGTLAARVHVLAGPGLERESVPLGPRDVGDVVVTGGHGLPVERVVHVVTPHADRVGGAIEGLEAVYRRAWNAAARHGALRVACPLLATGRRGTTAVASAAAAVMAAHRWHPRWPWPLHVVMVADAPHGHAVLARGLEALGVGSCQGDPGPRGPGPRSVRTPSTPRRRPRLLR